MGAPSLRRRDVLTPDQIKECARFTTWELSQLTGLPSMPANDADFIAGRELLRLWWIEGRCRHCGGCAMSRDRRSPLVVLEAGSVDGA